MAEGNGSCFLHVPERKLLNTLNFTTVDFPGWPRRRPCFLSTTRIRTHRLCTREPEARLHEWHHLSNETRFYCAEFVFSRAIVALLHRTTRTYTRQQQECPHMHCFHTPRRRTTRLSLAHSLSLPLALLCTADYTGFAPSSRGDAARLLLATTRGMLPRPTTQNEQRSARLQSQILHIHSS